MNSHLRVSDNTALSEAARQAKTVLPVFILEEPKVESSLNFTPLPRSFFEPSAEVVAPRLLGHLLVRRTPSGLSGGIIVETEAYLADDPACHGFKRETPRNRAMYGPAGHAYVYFIYGNHYCFNTVCRPAGVAEAVLVRALEPVFGEEIMRANRHAARPCELTNGPAKLCEAMQIDRCLDGVDLSDVGSMVFVACNPEWENVRQRLAPVVRTVRIGITKAADLPLRFYLEKSSFVSRPPGRWNVFAGSGQITG